MALEIPRWLAELVRAHAAMADPEEACGLIAGEVGGPPEWAWPVPNATPHDPTLEFFIDPHDQFRFEREAAFKPLWGIYHSHPEGRAKPSGKDYEAAKLRPDAMQLIYSVPSRELGVWAIDLESGEWYEVEHRVGV